MTGRMTALPGAEPFRSEIGIELIPGIPHRRQAVADMSGRGRVDDRLHRAVAHAEHEIEPVEIELLDRHRKERQVVAVDAAATWQALDERGVDPPALDGRRDRAANVHEGKELRVGKALAQDLERSSPPRMPVSQSWTSAMFGPA